jgi:lipoprotein-anchoring transpeptidase ErfK/SrfK
MLRDRRIPLALAVAPLALGLGAVACSETRTSPTSVTPSPSSSSGGAAAASAAAAPSPSGSAAAASAAAAQDAGPYEGPWIGATVMQAPISSDMEYPSSDKSDRGDKPRAVRLGSLRYGERAPVLPEPHKKANCPEGWYELLAGGFVCGKYATLDLDHPRFRLVKAPDLAGPLPYTYGINVSNGTPLYRQVPSREERIKLEPWLSRPRKAKSDDDGNPYAPASATSTPDAGAAPVDPSIGEGAGDKPDTPWWQKDAPDGGPPAVTLEDLQEADGPISRRMVKGFFLSLDHQFGSGGSMWWKTMSGLVAPADRIFVTKPVTEFHGVWLGQDAASFATKNNPSRRIDKLPVGFVLTFHAHKYNLDAAHKHASQVEGVLDRFQAVGLTGESAAASDGEYWETDEGWWLKGSDSTRTEPGPPPDKLGDHDKWIDVNQRRQTLVAFEGTTPVYVTLFSSGRNEHETPVGSFRIREKHIASTMDGDADTAADGPYSIEDVPYIQYFNAGYALHGAFWHAEFGRVKSHGCVNLSPWDAKGIFGWTDPQLPEGWHSVAATKEHPGTRVVVHERGAGTCRGPKLDACH